MKNLRHSIIGIGTDIVSLQRIRAVLKRYPTRFPRRILHPQELSAFNWHHNAVAFLARRFAAKEAVAKALGLGFAKTVYACNVCISNDAHGAPSVTLHGNTQRSFPAVKILISVADERTYAVAYAMALSADHGA